MNSVTGILSTEFHKYETAPTTMLMMQTDYGNKVHDYVGELLRGRSVNVNLVSYVRNAVASAFKMINRYLIQALTVEEPINWTSGLDVMYTTRSDFRGYINGQRALMDIKGTKNKDLEYWSFQLSAYAWAYKEKEAGNPLITDLYVMHLPKDGRHQLIKVDLLPRQKVLDLLKAGTYKLESYAECNYDPNLMKYHSEQVNYW